METGDLIKGALAVVATILGTLFGKKIVRRQEKARAAKLEAEADSISVSTAGDSLEIMRKLNKTLVERVFEMEKRYGLMEKKIEQLERKVWELEQERDSLHQELNTLRQENETLRSK